MASKLFNIIGIRHPGQVDLFQIGTVHLHLIDDEKLMQIYQKKLCPYLIPTNAGRKKLGLKPIETNIIIPVNNKNQKKNDVEIPNSRKIPRKSRKSKK